MYHGKWNITLHNILDVLSTKPDLFKDTGSVDAVADAVDQFEKAHAERLQRSVFHQRRIVKIKVNEHRLGK